LIPLLDSVTLAQAALLAAIGEVALTLYYLVGLAPVLSGHTPISNIASAVLGTIIPSLIWAGFFSVIYREGTGVPRALTVRAAAWITLFLGIGLQVIFVLVPLEMTTIFLTPLGFIGRVDTWLLRLAWVVFLVLFGRMPADRWTRRIALLLAILSFPYALSTAYGAFNNGIGFLLDDMPRQALWRALITPVIRTTYWVSQILFLWTVWGEPLRRDPLDASSARLAP
jgi:hypothetical protein